MAIDKLHFHSIMVHVIVALAPLTALAYICQRYAHVVGIAPETFKLTTVFGILFIFLVSLPAILTGILERNRHYAKWHPTHKIKMILSVLIIGVTIIEMLCWIAPNGHFLKSRAFFSPYGILVIFGNPTLAFLLSMYGLKITMGRQSLSRTSYTPDLFSKPKRKNIIEKVRVLVYEKAKIVDLDNN